jgi:hypothetical protein
MQSVSDWLADNGVATNGLVITHATGVSADGNTVVGTLVEEAGAMTTRSRAYIARVGPDNTTNPNPDNNTDKPTVSSGLMDVEQFIQGLGNVSNSAQLAANDANLILNGLHSQPMRSLLAEGQSTFWLAGDYAQYNRGNTDRDQSIAEFGFGHRFNDLVQFNLSLGHTYSKANTGLGGATRANTNYVLPEFIFSLPASVYATLTGYYGQGTSDIHRIYMNGSNTDHSRARPDVDSLGARLRFDWINALQWQALNLSPYVSFSYQKTTLSSYTEHDVAFPVNWHERTSKDTTAVVGIDGVYGLNASTNILGRIEGAHRFESKGADTAGDIVGISPFNFTGQKIDQNWLRLGAGVEKKFRDGVFNVMLNATTQGEMPNYWISANYRWLF